MSLQPKPHVQESTYRKGASYSEVHERPDYKGLKNTSNLKKVVLINNHPTIAVGFRIMRDIRKKRDQNFRR